MSKTPATAQWTEPAGSGVAVEIGLGKWIQDPAGAAGDLALAHEGVTEGIWIQDPTGAPGDLLISDPSGTALATWLTSGDSFLLKEI